MQPPIPVRVVCKLCTWVTFEPTDPEHARHFWWCQRSPADRRRRGLTASDPYLPREIDPAQIERENTTPTHTPDGFPDPNSGRQGSSLLAPQ